MRGQRKSDWGDFAALGVSAVAAAVAPLQTLLFAYIFLGPMHYQTEIVWLRDKDFYFREGVVSVRIYLGIASLTAVAVVAQGWWKQDFSFWMILPLLLVSLSIWMKNRFVLTVVALVGVALTLMLRTWVFFIAVMVPTLVHVFFFTWIFMVIGALRKSGGGWMKWVNPALMVLLPLGLIGLNLHYGQPSAFWLRSEGASFLQMHQHLAGDVNRTMVLNATMLNDRWIAAMLRVFAFAYLFHYLNWFAKTELLQWHKVPAKMWMAMVCGYGAAIGIFMWNMRVGFLMINALSMMHVLLEFPLNWHTLRILLAYRRRPAAVAEVAAI